MKREWIGALVVWAVVALSACDDGAVGGSGISTSKPVNSLTAVEKGLVCDWLAGRFGGYGAEGGCGYVVVPPTQADCVSELSTCGAAVGQFEACAETLRALPPIACSQNDRDRAMGAPACQASVGCF